MCKVLLSIFIFFLGFSMLNLNLAADCEVYGLVLKTGESHTIPGKCSLLTCNGKGYDSHSVSGCPNAYSPPHCKFVPVDLNKAYPDCCPHWEC